MERRLRFASKEEAHKLIDEMPGDYILVMTYDNSIGISNRGEFVNKKRSKKYVDNSKTLVVVDSRPIITLNLHNKSIKDLSGYYKEDIAKSIMLAKLK